MYTLKPDVVQDAIERLIEAPIHRLFPGYLLLHQSAQRQRQTTNLEYPYRDFFDKYFRVESKSDHPYFIPFRKGTDISIQNLWLSDHLAGTYAHSSIRDESAFLDVAEKEEGGQDPRMGLDSQHWLAAHIHLAHGELIPAESLAAFLFRDHAFTTDSPSAPTLIDAFTERFEYDLGGDAFTSLYETSDTDIDADDFVETEANHQSKLQNTTILSPEPVRRLSAHELQLPVPGSEEVLDKEDRREKLQERAKVASTIELTANPVGAAIYTTTHEVFTGTDFPVSSGMTGHIHALSVAIMKAVTETSGEVLDATIYVDGDFRLCGSCRDLLIEHGVEDATVEIVTSGGQKREIQV